MPIRFDISGRVLQFTTVGDVVFSEGMQILREGLLAGRGEPRDLLFDLRQSTENRSAEELYDIAAMIREHQESLSKRLVAVVASPLHYGLGRMFGSMLDGFDVNVFTDRDAADAWLRQPTRT